MVLNLDKCIGCHTCSVTCKNVWTNREGMEYAWFNNVETKPGIGFPKDWENQKRWNGGWRRKANGKIEPKMGAKWRILAKIFANPDLPEIDDYYEPFDFDYAHLQNAPEMQAFPTARPRSKITGERMEKIEWGPNWEEILGGEFSKRSVDYNFEGVEKEIYGASKHGSAFFANQQHMNLDNAKWVVGEDYFNAPTCATCHTLFGEGQKIGPDLTGSDRHNLDYLLGNIIDPNAVVPADYRVSVIKLKDGRTLTGVIPEQTDKVLTVQTPAERVSLQRSDVAEMQQLSQSLMPEGLLTALGEENVRHLISYLMSSGQVPLPQ